MALHEAACNFASLLDDDRLWASTQNWINAVNELTYHPRVTALGGGRPGLAALPRGARMHRVQCDTTNTSQPAVQAPISRVRYG